MTACVRIYTSMGKENCLSVDTFTLSTEDFAFDHSEINHVVTFSDRDEDRVTEIKRIVEAGQPCNMHIRYKDDTTEAVCTLNGCKLVDARILCDKPDMKIIRYEETNND